MSKIKNMEEASRAVIQFAPPEVRLSDGTCVYVHRLSWLQFEDIYKDLAEGITDYVTFTTLNQQAAQKTQTVQFAFAATGEGTDAAVTESAVQAAVSDANASTTQANDALSTLVAKLTEAPALASKLVLRTTRKGVERAADLIARADIDAWDFDDVLACAMAAVNVNFIENQKITSFFVPVMNALAAKAGVK